MIKLDSGRGYGGASTDVRVRSLNEGLAFFEKHTSDGKWWFRGQRESWWGLSPGIFRARNRVDRQVTAANRFTEANMLRKFKEATRLMLPIEPRGEWEWLALAQHHGLLTRLLDWTENPLVALYFAVQNASEGDSAVWCLKTLVTYDMTRDPWDYEEVITVYLPHISPRIGVQKGVFTSHPFPDQSVEEWSLPLKKVIIDKASRVAIRTQLRAFGIDRATLFPDFDGIAYSINNSLCLVEADE